MSVRKLKFELSANSISPQTVQAGGVQFEHNATQAIFVIPNELYTLINGIGESKTVLYRVDAVDGEGGYHVSETIEPLLSADSTEEYHLIYPIPYDVSSIGGTCQLTVVATRIDENSAEEMIYCSETAFIQFSHVSRSSLQHDKFKSELGGILNEAKGYMIESAAVDDSGKLYVRYVNGKTVYVGVSNLLSSETITAAINATNNANKAAESAQSAAEEANAAADNASAVRQEIEEGGFIESLKELNNGDKFTFWVGTKAEYEALTETIDNCFYLITDDTTTQKINAIADYIVEQGTKTVNYYNNNSDELLTTSATWYYELWNSGKAACWATLKATHTTDTASIIKAKTPYPISFIDKPIVLATLCSGNGSADLPLNIKYQHLLDIEGVQVCVHNPDAPFTEESTATVSVELKGFWK